MGGPAELSQRIVKGDIILEIDGENATPDNIERLLVGNDKPGSPVLLTVAKSPDVILSCCPSLLPGTPESVCSTGTHRLRDRYPNVSGGHV